MWPTAQHLALQEPYRNVGVSTDWDIPDSRSHVQPQPQPLRLVPPPGPGPLGEPRWWGSEARAELRKGRPRPAPGAGATVGARRGGCAHPGESLQCPPATSPRGDRCPQGYARPRGRGCRTTPEHSLSPESTKDSGFPTSPGPTRTRAPPGTCGSGFRQWPHRTPAWSTLIFLFHFFLLLNADHEPLNYAHDPLMG